MFILQICIEGPLSARHFSRGRRPESKHNGWIPPLVCFLFWLPPLPGMEMLWQWVCENSMEMLS